MVEIRSLVEVSQRTPRFMCRLSRVSYPLRPPISWVIISSKFLPDASLVFKGSTLTLAAHLDEQHAKTFFV